MVKKSATALQGFLKSQQLEVLKWIAIIAMVVDHVYRINLGQNPDFAFMEVIGRLAFPIFAFGVAYNYLYHTKNAASYLKRMFVLALISQIPYELTLVTPEGKNLFNIFFTLGLGATLIFMIQRYEAKKNRKNLFELGVVGFLTFVLGPVMDFGLEGVLLVPLFYYWLQRRDDLLLLGMLLIYLWILQPYGLLAVAVMASFGLILGMAKVDFKNKWRLPKWLSYGFYPLHLIILYLVEVL